MADRPRVAPYLTVTPAAAAIAFYTAAFGARQKALMPSLDGLRIAHCELIINGGSVMLKRHVPGIGHHATAVANRGGDGVGQPGIRQSAGGRRCVYTRHDA